jgi:predicted DNA-binding transcriptional regulator AlpA
MPSPSPVTIDLPTSLAREVEGVAIISPKRCSTITSLSTRQQDRLEAAGKFPRSIRLGEGRNARKGRLLSDVLDWNRARIAAALNGETA